MRNLEEDYRRYAAIEKYYIVRYNGGLTGMKAASPEKAIEKYAALHMWLHTPEGITIEETTEEEFEKCYYKMV